MLVLRGSTRIAERMSQPLLTDMYGVLGPLAGEVPIVVYAPVLCRPGRRSDFGSCIVGRGRAVRRLLAGRRPCSVAHRKSSNIVSLVGHMVAIQA